MNVRTIFLALGVLIIVLGIGDVVLLTSHHLLASRRSSTAATASKATGCVSLQLFNGSSGSCVRDVQTMTNFVETNGLNECPFTGGARLTVNGTYDAATRTQVKIIQTWYNCYNHQEGSKQALTTNGFVNGATWQALCSYAYKLPSQANSSASPYREASLTAGKNADCPSLF